MEAITKGIDKLMTKPNDENWLFGQQSDIIVSEILRLSKCSWQAATTMILERATKTSDPVSRHHLRMVPQDIEIIARTTRYQFDRLTYEPCIARALTAEWSNIRTYHPEKLEPLQAQCDPPVQNPSQIGVILFRFAVRGLIWEAAVNCEPKSSLTARLTGDQKLVYLDLVSGVRSTKSQIMARVRRPRFLSEIFESLDAPLESSALGSSLRIPISSLGGHARCTIKPLYTAPKSECPKGRTSDEHGPKLL